MLRHPAVHAWLNFSSCCLQSSAQTIYFVPWIGFTCFHTWCSGLRAFLYKNKLVEISFLSPNTAMTETTASVKRSAGVSGWHSPMQRVSKEGLQDRISTSLLEHWVQVWQGFSAESTSEKVPGLHVWHTVSPWMPHSWTTPVPFMHLEQGAHTLCWAKKKKPSSHSHSVFLVAEQGRRVGTPSGQLLHGRQRPRPWDSENVPREKITKSASV